MKLSIIIPAYNEEKVIENTLKEYYLFLNKEFKDGFELIVVTNNCSDNTVKIVNDFIEEKKEIKIFNIPSYSGKGGAIIQGFRLAQGDCIGFVDADNSVTPREFYKLYENIEGNDGIIASRKLAGSIINPKRSFYRTLSSNLFSIYIRKRIGLKYGDTQCGCKLFKKEIIESLINELTEEGWIFDVDILYLCKKKNYRILEYPIIWIEKENSKVTFIQGLKSINKLFKYEL